MKTITKTTIIFLSAVMLFACIGNFAKPLVTSAGLVGDINEDGIVNSKDLSMLQKIILGQYKVDETPYLTEEPALEPTKEPVATPVPVKTPSISDISGAPHPQRGFATVEEFMSWAAKKEERYERIGKLYEDIEKDGGVYVPYYDNVPMEFTRLYESTSELMEGYSDALYGYMYYGIKDIDGKGTGILVKVILGDKRNKIKEFISDCPEDVLKELGVLEIVTNVGGEEKEVIFRPHSDDDANERAFFLHEGRVMYILFYSKNTENNLEILEKISFEKVLFEEIEK